MTTLAKFSPILWAPPEQSVQLDGLEIAAFGGTLHVSARDAGGTTLDISADGELIIRLSVPLGDASGYWHPGAGGGRNLPADWSTELRTSLVNSSPSGCLYDSAGRSIFGFSLDWYVREADMRYGVSEEHRRFGVWIAIGGGGQKQLRLTTPGRTVAETAASLRDWHRTLAASPAMAVPDAGRGVTYSTWYAFAQDVAAATVEKELAVAAESGLSLAILDDGWQQYGSGRGYAGCGDWVADPVKFPDLSAHVERAHALGYHYCAWVAPLLIGPRSQAFSQWSAYAPRYEDGLKCNVLDPRHAAVRQHIVSMCSRMLTEYGFDGLKIDFLDSCMTYAGSPAAAGQDIDDVGEAMAVLLGEIREEFDRIRPAGALIEFRQPYIGPAISRFANLLRVGDCPADAVTNRVGAIDLRLTAADAAVHSDPILWHDDAPVETIARQMQASLFSVPQLSVRLSEASAAHRAAIGFWTSFWQSSRDVLLQGDFEPGMPNALYPVVQASRGPECVIACYRPEPLSVDLGQWEQLQIVNSTDAATVILQANGTEVTRARVETWSAAGQSVGATDREFGAGLHTIAIPPFGLAKLVMLPQ